MAETVLVIEDQVLVRDLVVLNLKHAGYRVLHESTFAGGARALVQPEVELAIVDVMLPGGEGFQLVRDARDAGARFPVMMLTARSEVTARVRGLDCGADDYLTKPFDVGELLARVRSLLRRASGAFTSGGPTLRLSGGYSVRFDTGRAVTAKGELTLADAELKLLDFFMRNAARVVSRSEILEEPWGASAFPYERAVEESMARLRSLFEQQPEAPTHFVAVNNRAFLFRP